jgi:hypothetical protein
VDRDARGLPDLAQRKSATCAVEPHRPVVVPIDLSRSQISNGRRAFLRQTMNGTSTAAQSAATVFKGRPSVKISKGGVERMPEQLPRERAIKLECVIRRIGDKYYWASRENVEMVKLESGAFVTYIALNGSGYVRTISQESKNVASLSSTTEVTSLLTL